jgi:PqqD family protein of HPr-rel-A system
VIDRPERAPHLDVNLVSDGYVVFDPRSDRVHYLNHTAALVLELCNGQNTRAEIVEVLQSAYGLPEPPHDVTEQCLGQLRAEGLLT